jgi:hypothetical protein
MLPTRRWRTAVSAALSPERPAGQRGAPADTIDEARQRLAALLLRSHHTWLSAGWPVGDPLRVEAFCADTGYRQTRFDAGTLAAELLPSR